MDTLKKAVYLPLESTDYISTTSLNIRMNYNLEGYAIYTILREKLIDIPERYIQIKDLNSIAFDLHCDIKILNNIIDNYFQKDNENTYFYSEELNNRMQWFDDKYNKCSEAGKKSASMLTEEQRKLKAKKASETRWNKSKEDLTKEDNILTLSNNMLTLSNNMLTLSIENLTPLAVDANNKIEKNKIEKNKIEENIKKENKIEKNDLESFSSLDNSFEKDSKENNSFLVEENEKDTSIDYFKKFDYYEDPSYIEYSQFNYNKGMDLLNKLKDKHNFSEDKLLQLSNGLIVSNAIINFKQKEKENIDPLNVFCNFLVNYSSTEKNNPIWEEFLYQVKTYEDPIIYNKLFEHFDLKLIFLKRIPKEGKNIKNPSNEEVFEFEETNI